MQNEDDVRSLAKIIELLRAVSILIAIIHIYWFCYEAVQVLNINLGVVDKILLNFQKTTSALTCKFLSVFYRIKSPFYWLA